MHCIKKLVLKLLNFGAFTAFKTISQSRSLNWIYWIVLVGVRMVWEGLKRREMSETRGQEAADLEY
jgi:hypothetical protein